MNTAVILTNQFFIDEYREFLVEFRSPKCYQGDDAYSTVFLCEFF